MKKIYSFLLLLSLPFWLNAETYFIHLTTSGLLQRPSLLSGQFAGLSALKKASSNLRFRSLGKHDEFTSWLTIRSESSEMPALLQNLQNTMLIDFAEPVKAFRVTGVPNDSLLSQQWYLNIIKAPAAWDSTSGSPSVIVGVIDTGVDYTHPDLQGALWQNLAEVNGLDGVDDDENGYPEMLMATVWVGIRSSAVTWIDENQPQHWARPMFAE